MRGRRDRQITLLAFIDLEERVPPDHPPRTIERLAASRFSCCRPGITRRLSATAVVEHEDAPHSRRLLATRR
jgi:hypothetical protein